ncbi:hypothetical protein AB0O01_35495 [Streptomyces sp. NPDC093252]|uniref:radical SAM protein n=1 Tax=Streptomyces sp. NPDC093252 TaxID=3154980 RepID=UPI003416D26A
MPLIDEAAALGTTSSHLIGGELTRHPDFAIILEYALRAGLRMRVFSNLVRVRDAHWKLLEHPRIDLATSVYSDDPVEHDTITARRGSHAATRAGIVKAPRHGCRVRVSIIDLGAGQRVAQARADTKGLVRRAVGRPGRWGARRSPSPLLVRAVGGPSGLVCGRLCLLYPPFVVRYELSAIRPAVPEDFVDALLQRQPMESFFFTSRY